MIRNRIYNVFTKKSKKIFLNVSESLQNAHIYGKQKNALSLHSLVHFFYNRRVQGVKNANIHGKQKDAIPLFILLCISRIAGEILKGIKNARFHGKQEMRMHFPSAFFCAFPPYQEKVFLRMHTFTVNRKMHFLCAFLSQWDKFLEEIENG